MARKTNEANASEKLHRATAEAAHILAGDLAAYSAMLHVTLEEAGEESDSYERGNLLDTAGSLVDSMAKLGETIGGLKDEMRQHIRVERNAHRGEIVPQSASNSAAPKAKKAKRNGHKKQSRAAKPRGEGV